MKFELIRSNFSFIVPEEEVIEDVFELFSSYNVEIDFTNRKHEDGHIQVMCIISVNAGEQPKPGYSMVAEGMGVFQITDAEKLDKKVLGNLRFYSTLNMMINNLRNIIFQQSNLGPMGGYLLPPIDVLDLFEKKDKEIKSKKRTQCPLAAPNLIYLKDIK